ncbi:MAG: ABC transporter permease [Candidatus Komeilibacteria bacterium]|nr:ABC transporter permease [Candidatus Komeilibacteria bacterium]
MQTALYIREAIGSLLVNKLRSFLTMFGIIIGIAAIVIIISVGDGAQSLVINQVNSLGSNIVAVLPGASDDNEPPATALGISITSLKYTDATALRDQVQGLIGVAAYVRGVGAIASATESIDSNYTGVTPDYFFVEDTALDRGYTFTEDDNRSLNRVAVLGWKTYTDLFGSADPLDQFIRVQRQSFRVIGVLKERGTSGFQSQDDQVFIPILTAQKLLLGIDHVGFIRAKAAEGENLDFVAEDIRAVLRERHGIEKNESDDFSVRTITQALDVLGTITDVLRYFLAAISALALIVGGIGIMNIMLVVVLERTQEIGLRKALGARPYHLRMQFLFETMVISLLGGIIGLLIGTGVSYGIAVVVNSLGYFWRFTIGSSSIALSFIFPVIIGLVFGFYPAQKAARLKPIEALHYE